VPGTLASSGLKWLSVKAVSCLKMAPISAWHLQHHLLHGDAAHREACGPGGEMHPHRSQPSSSGASYVECRLAWDAPETGAASLICETYVFTQRTSRITHHASRFTHHVSRFTLHASPVVCGCQWAGSVLQCSTIKIPFIAALTAIVVDQGA
jgi:hypothetical protein